MIAIYSNSNPLIYGGVEMLVYRLAKYLRDRGVKFLVIEPEGSLLYSQIEPEYILSPSKILSVASRIETIFFPNISKIRHIDTKFECLSQARFVGWIVHPNEPYRSFMPYSGRFLEYVGYKGVAVLDRLFTSNYSAAATFFDIAIQKNSVLSMDAACSRALKYYYPVIKKNPPILQIPCEISEQIDGKIRKSNSLSIAYFGRLDGFKASALMPIVSNHLAALAREREVKLHIFGDGPFLDSVIRKSRSNRIDVEVHGHLANKLARRQIRINTDFAIAMGTAALDVAVTGHPCIYIDPALSKFATPQKKFRFVHQTEDFTLGEYRDFPYYVPGVSNFDLCVDEILEADCGLKGRNYVVRNHNADLIFENLLSHFLGTRATLSDLLPSIFDINEEFLKAKRIV